MTTRIDGNVGNQKMLQEKNRELQNELAAAMAQNAT